MIVTNGTRTFWYNIIYTINIYLKQFDKAILDYNKAIELAPGEAKFYNYRGQLYENELNQFEKSLSDYNKAIELEPKEGEWLFNRAFLY